MEGIRFNRIDRVRGILGICGGKSYAVADIAVLRSPPIPFPDLKHKKRSFRN